MVGYEGRFMALWAIQAGQNKMAFDIRHVPPSRTATQLKGEALIAVTDASSSLLAGDET